MSERHPTTAVSDAQLVTELRAGERRAMAELYARHNTDAVRIGRIVQPNGDAEELAAEAFVRVFAKIIDGGGPTDNFLAYLHTVVRNLKIERTRQASREQPASDKMWLLDTATDDGGPEVDENDAARAARAIRTLPENWQQLLWKLEVEGRKPADVAAELSVPVAKVSDTAYRAREGLRLAYLNQHLPAASDGRCDWSRDRLGRHARGSLSPRAASKIRHHLDECTECAALYDELHQLNTRLGAMLWPVVFIGTITLGTVASTAPNETPKPSSTSTVRRFRPRSVAGRARMVHPAVVAAAATALVAAVAAIGLALVRDDAQLLPSGGSQPSQSDSAPDRALPSDDLLTEDADELPFTADTPMATPPASTPPARETPEPPAPAKDRPDRRPSQEPRPQPVPVPAPAPSPDPSPAPSPGPPEEPAEPGPVDLGVGSPTVDAAGQPNRWLLTIPILSVEGPAAESFTLSLELTLNDISGFVERQSTDWDCGPIQDGDSGGNPYFFDSVTCQYTYQPGQAVAPFALVVESIAAPTGAIAISGAGNADPSTADNERMF